MIPSANPMREFSRWVDPARERIDQVVMLMKQLEQLEEERDRLRAEVTLLREGIKREMEKKCATGFPPPMAMFSNPETTYAQYIAKVHSPQPPPPIHINVDYQFPKPVGIKPFPADQFATPEDIPDRKARIAHNERIREARDYDPLG